MYIENKSLNIYFFKVLNLKKQLYFFFKKKLKKNTLKEITTN